MARLTDLFKRKKPPSGSKFDTSTATDRYKSVVTTLKEAGIPNAEKNAELIEGLFANGALGGYDPDANLTAQTGGSLFYRKLTQNMERDLNPLMHDRMIEIAAWLYDTNPIAKRLLEIPRDYILGEGVSVTAVASDDEQRADVQEIIDGFWQDPYNDLDTKLHNKVLELGLYGEYVITINVNKVNGHVRLSVCDPSLILQVICDPLNIERVLALSLREELQKGNRPAEHGRLKVLQIDETPGSDSYGRYTFPETDDKGNITETYRLYDNDGVPIGDPIPYIGACFYFRVNGLSTARRGRSDLLALIDYLDGYDQLIFGELDRLQMIKDYLWDVTLNDASDAQVAKFIKDVGRPKPGTVRAHNEKVSWDVVSPKLNEADTAAGADLVLSTISTGAGRPKTWLNGTMDVNKSASEELSEPAFKSLTARQKVVKSMISLLITFTLDQAELHGLLPRRKNLKDGSPERWSFAINLPDLRASDLNDSATSFQDTMLALQIANENRFMDKKSIQEIIKIYASQLGVEIDLEIMNENIASEGKDQAAIDLKTQQQQAKLQIQAKPPVQIGSGSNK